MKTKGALLYGVGQQWQVEEIEVGDPLPGEVMVKLAASGLCHSDDHLVTGDISVPRWPILGGHEGAGVVIKVGPGVTRVAEGDHVVLSLAACGACEPCRNGHQAMCDESKAAVSGEMIADGGYRVTNKEGADVVQFCLEGTFAPYATVNQMSVVKIADDMPLHLAALLGCCVTSGWGAATRSAGVGPGDVAVIAGFGGLGCSALFGSLAAGASHVIVIDPLPNKQEMALKLGASMVFGSFEEAFEPLAHLTNGAMAHAVVLTIGRMEGRFIEPAMSLTRKHGTVAVIGLGRFDDIEVTLNLQTLTGCNKRLQGGQAGGASPQEDIQMFVRLYQAGKLPLESLVTKTYRLEDINEGYQDMRDGKNLRGLIVYGDDDA